MRPMPAAYPGLFILPGSRLARRLVDVLCPRVAGRAHKTPFPPSRGRVFAGSGRGLGTTAQQRDPLADMTEPG
jgi:hypothetical protein